jgi:hypothetical protein
MLFFYWFAQQKYNFGVKQHGGTPFFFKILVGQ